MSDEEVRAYDEAELRVYAGLCSSACACTLHLPSGCCDPDDCGPCCPDCPTCPTLARLRAEGRSVLRWDKRNSVDGGAA